MRGSSRFGLREITTLTSKIYNHKSLIVTNVKKNNTHWLANFKLDGGKENHKITDVYFIDKRGGFRK
jgi:hypothetical protein